MLFIGKQIGNVGTDWDEEKKISPKKPAFLEPPLQAALNAPHFALKTIFTHNSHVTLKIKQEIHVV
jgi:hypothetical protein